MIGGGVVLASPLCCHLPTPIAPTPCIVHCLSLPLSLPLFPGSPIADCSSSSVLSHCAYARLRPCSASMRNVAGACHTHCLQPMHVFSSTKTARCSFGSAFFAILGRSAGIHLDSGSPE